MKLTNVIMCDSFTLANDTLAADPEWNRVSINCWMWEGEAYRVITEARYMRGLRLDKVMEIGEVSLDLRRMANERRMLRD